MATAPTTDPELDDVKAIRRDMINEDTGFIVGMLSPTGFIFAIGIFFPIVYGLWLSLWYTSRIGNVETFVLFNNYLKFFQDAEFWRAYYNTVLFTAVTVFFELIFGLIIALIVNKSFKGRGIVRAAILVPWAIPTIVNARLWEFIFRPDGSGLANDIFIMLGLVDKPLVLYGASRRIPINLLWLVMFIIFVGTLFILLYTYLRKLYNQQYDEMAPNRNEIIIMALFIVSLVMVVLIPMLSGIDSWYGSDGTLSLFTVRFPTEFMVVFLVDIWKTTPFMALLILASLQTIPQDLYKAAVVDGASPWQQFRQITLPLLVPGLGVALIFRSIDAFRVYDILVIFGAKAIESITKVSVTEIKFGRYGSGASVAVFTFLNIIVFTLLFFYLTRRSDD